MKKIPLLILLQILIPLSLIAQYSYGYRNVSMKISTENHPKKLLNKTDLVSPNFKFVGSEDYYSIYLKKGKYGLLFNNSFLTEPIFDKIDFLSRGIFQCTQITNKDTSTVLISRNPNFQITLPFDTYVKVIYGTNHFEFSSPSGNGIINYDQKLIIPPIYNRISLYCKGYYLATNSKQFDIYNFEGTKTYSNKAPYVDSSFLKSIRIFLPYYPSECFLDTLIPYRISDTLYHLLTLEGNVIDSSFNYFNDRKCRFGVENYDQKEKLKTSNNEEKTTNENPIFLEEYDQNRIWHYYKNNMVYIVKKNGKWGVVDENNKIIFSFSYDEIERESFFLKFTKNKQSFLIDFYGRIYKIN
jgi:hypothetical protein